MNKRYVLSLTLIACCLFPHLLSAQERPQKVSDWISISPPIPEFMKHRPDNDYSYQDPGVAYYAASYSNNSWKVSMSGGNIYAENVGGHTDFLNEEQPPFTIPERKPFFGDRICVAVDEGWLVGFNAGEFGHSLWWFSSDGSKEYKVSDDQIVQFVRWNGGLYALEGLAHLGLSRGNLVKLTNNEKHALWKSIKVASLPGAPRTAVVDKDGALVVVTNDGLARITYGYNIEVLLSDTFWSGLYPISAVVGQNDNIYIGMRQGIAKWHIGNKSDAIEWLVPSTRYMENELKSFCESIP